MLDHHVILALNHYFFRSFTDKLTCLMMRLFLCCFLALLHLNLVSAQEHLPHSNANLAPFYHGVASGQPATNGFVIWTRIAPSALSSTPNIDYFVSESIDFQLVVRTGTISAQEARDYTARVALTGLKPDTYYYYYFKHGQTTSLIGRGKTLPLQTDHLKFAVFSCARFESGHFNAYGAAAKRNDLDAVIHLGDYIYEYTTNFAASGQAILPNNELLSLADYRARYGSYRLDSNLIRLHQQHTMIQIWDDHESANDSHNTGAQNHQTNEGTWIDRKKHSKQAWHEWMPTTLPETSPIYRQYAFGDLAQVQLLDTRIDGREPQPLHFDTPDTTRRKIMSQEQFIWLTDGLKTATQPWKILGNQVIFSGLNFGFLAGATDGAPDPTNLDSIRIVEDRHNDMWEAYPSQRNALLDTIARNNIQGVTFLTGDSHASWVFDVAQNPVLYPLPKYNYMPQLNPYQAGVGGYNHLTRAGTLAVEFCTPSVSSPNYDENFGTFQASILESVLNTPVNPPDPAYNPHLRYCDLDQHGYTLIDVQRDTMQANFYYANTITTPNLAETFGKAYYQVRNQSGAFSSVSPSANKSVQATPTPTLPFGTVHIERIESPIFLSGVYPNPAQNTLFVHVFAQKSGPLHLEILDTSGRVCQLLFHDLSVGSNLVTFQLNPALSSGVYFLYDTGGKSVRFIKE
jgi:alkaline phosphatase D